MGQQRYLCFWGAGTGQWGTECHVRHDVKVSHNMYGQKVFMCTHVVSMQCNGCSRSMCDCAQQKYVGNVYVVSCDPQIEHTHAHGYIAASCLAVQQDVQLRFRKGCMITRGNPSTSSLR